MLIEFKDFFFQSFKKQVIDTAKYLNLNILASSFRILK